MNGRVVVGAGRIRAVIQAHGGLAPRFVHRDLLPLDLHRQRFRTLSDPRCRPPGPLRQQVSESPSKRDLFHHSVHRFGIAEGQIQAVRVFPAQNSLFKAFHRKGDRHTRGDRIDPVAVADFSGLDQRFQIVDSTVGTEGCQGFVLGPAVHRVSRRGTLQSDHPLAADGASVAVVHFHHVLFTQDLRGNLLDTRKPAPLKVSDRQIPVRFITQHVRTGPIPPLSALLFIIHHHPAVQFAELSRIGSFRQTAAPDGDRLEPLRAHHRPHPGSSGRMGHVIQNTGKSDLFFTGRTDHRRANARVSQLFPDGPFRIRRLQSPETTGVADLRFPILDPQINRFGGNSLDNDRLETRPLELGAPKPAGLRFPIPTGHRGFAPDAVSPAADERMPRQCAQRKHQPVLRSEWVDAFGHFG